eukprot:m.212641 g.212641  ORF g.212641 m.212641 type:complete len:104 (-) comp16947_c2_seq6:59-370(-)
MHRLAAVYLVTDAIVEAEALFSHTSRQAHADRWPELHISSLQGLCACYAHRKKWSRLAASCCNLLAVAKDPSLSVGSCLRLPFISPYFQPSVSHEVGTTSLVV